MNKLIIIFFSCLFMVVPVFAAERGSPNKETKSIYDKSWNRKGYIQKESKDSYTIYDKSWNRKGHIKDGSIYDKNWNRKGYIK